MALPEFILCDDKVKICNYFFLQDNGIRHGCQTVGFGQEKLKYELRENVTRNEVSNTFLFAWDILLDE